MKRAGTHGGIVAQPDRTIRHLPFFEALSGLEESSAEWRATTAGLVVLRLVDSWFEEGTSIASADAWGLMAVREAVEEIDAGNPARTILSGVVDAVASATRADFSLIAPRLSAYGRALHFDAKWRQAADVNETLLAYAHPIDEADVYINASMQLGFCLRMLGAWDEAAAAYADASRVAVSMGDVVGILRAQIADARLSVARGNLPRAEAILDETIVRAKNESLTDVIGLALHERATVAHERGQYERSVLLGYEALEHTTRDTARDRVLVDIAVSFMELGVTSAARDAFLMLAATGQEQYVRWVASLNLLDIAIADGSEPAFESYRRDLAEASLPVVLEVNYHILAGKGYYAFGRLDRARGSLTQAIEIASQNRLNQLLFTAEQSLEKLEVGERLAARAEVEAPEQLADVATAIRTMRRLAGVGG
jgi:tetratricopeptide (TPR) repeat protein